MVLMLLGGNTGGFDALDAVPTDVYWQVKNVAPTLEGLQLDAGPDRPVGDVDQRLKELQSDDFATRDNARKQLEAMGPAALPRLAPAAASADPEVAAVAAGLVKRFSEQGRERQVRRLMAIRTLGERREQAALPLLQGLVQSPDPFVSDYARRAVASLEGRPFQPADRRPALDSDVTLLPANIALIAQCGGGAVIPEPLTLSRVVDLVADAAKKPGGLGNPIGRVDRPRMLQSFTRYSLTALERIGNFRIDGITLGLSSDIGDNAGFFAVIVHGRYDAATLAETLRTVSHAPPAATQPAGVPRLDVGDEIALLFPSDERLIVIFAGKAEERAKGVSALLAGLQNGKGTLDQNDQIAALLKKVNRAGPLWGVAKLTAEMQHAPFLAGVDSVILDTHPLDRTPAAKEGGGAGGGGTAYTLIAQGVDPKALAASLDVLNANLNDARQGLRQMAQQMAIYQGMLDFLEAMKTSAHDNTATLAGELKPALIHSLVGQAGPLLLMGVEEVDRLQQPPPATAPALPE